MEEELAGGGVDRVGTTVRRTRPAPGCTSCWTISRPGGSPARRGPSAPMCRAGHIAAGHLDLYLRDMALLG